VTNLATYEKPDPSGFTEPVFAGMPFMGIDLFRRSDL